MLKFRSFNRGYVTGRIPQFAHNCLKARRVARRFISTPIAPIVTTSSETVFTCLDYFCISNEPADNDPPQRGAHVLDIDLRLPLDYHNALQKKTLRALDRRVEARLADIIANDKLKAPEKRIDAIRATAAGPTTAMWSMFKDLNPRHLSFTGGFTEECISEPLRLMTTWNRLESIYLGGICSWNVFRLPPFVLHTLKSLDLHMCSTLDVRAIGNAASMMRLENLSIETNDVGESAVMLLKNFPSIKRSLKRLTLHTTFFRYENEEERTGIRRILTECTSLTDVKLSLSLHHAVYIAAFLPPAVQRIEFAGERSMALLLLIDDWIARAKDPNWAPNLRFLKLTVDREQLSFPERFFSTEICGEDEKPGQTSLSPGVPVTLPDPSQLEYYSPSAFLSDTQLDAETVSFDEFWPDYRYRYRIKADTVTDDPDEIDLDNLPGIGPHPNHVLDTERQLEDAAYRLRKKARSVGDEALADFEKAFAVKKEELYKILRDSRPGIELV